MEKDLPKGWLKVELQDIVADKYYPIGDGDHGKIKPKHYLTEGIPYIRVGDMGWGEFFEKKLVYISVETHNENLKSELVPGDILIAKTGATIGKCCIVPNHIKRANTTSSVGKVTIDEKITSPKWILYNFLSKKFYNMIWEHSHRTAQPGFNNKDLKIFKVYLPPLPEQQRIVAKLDTLYGHLDSLKARLEKIPQLLKNFRQSVLTQAVTGKLTEEWREGKELEDVDLDKLEKHREQLKREQAFKRGRKTYNHKIAVKPDIGGFSKGLDKLFELPEKWKWVSLDQVVWNVSDGPHFSPNYVQKGKGKRFISMRNISFNSINFSNCKYVSKDDHLEFIKRGKPEKNDIIYTKGGTTGIPCTILDDTNFSYWVHVALLKPIKAFVNSFYLRNSLASNLCYLQSQALTHGVGNQDLGLTRMIYISFPLAPYKEQEEIVKRVESMFSKADKIEAQYKSLKEKVDQLPQAILAKAFKGELVERLHSDGEAEELLEEIRMLKSKLSNKKK